jgi:hypothetical protein
LWAHDLWNDGYFVRSVGDKVTADIIRKYIEYQTHEIQASQLKMFEKSKQGYVDASQLAAGSFTSHSFRKVITSIDSLIFFLVNCFLNSKTFCTKSRCSFTCLLHYKGRGIHNPASLISFDQLGVYENIGLHLLRISEPLTVQEVIHQEF